MNIKSIENEITVAELPVYRCNAIYLLMLRFYFIFFPMYPLLSKFIGTSLWKDGLYIFFTIIGMNVFIKNKFLIWYFGLLALIVIFQVAQGYSYMEFLTWFLMGPPIFLYYRYITPAKYKNDLRLLILIMILGFLFVFLYEIPTRDSLFFELASEKATGTGGFFLRDDEVRARFGFVSPMAFSQYSWFIAVIILINNRFSKITRWLFAVLMVISIFYCNTRAGVFLTVLTVAVFFYTKFKFHKVKLYNLIVVLSIAFVVIFKNFISGQAANHNNETLSDELRMLLLLDGLNKAGENFIFGISGQYFSPRAKDWYDFENSWLSLIVCFGLIGIGMIYLFLRNIIFKSNSKYFLLLMIPWLGYSSIFPVLQEPTAVFITWVIIIASINSDKWNVLNGLNPQTLELSN